jgi:hypothetical protein
VLLVSMTNLRYGLFLTFSNYRGVPGGVVVAFTSEEALSSVLASMPTGLQAEKYQKESSALHPGLGARSLKPLIRIITLSPLLHIHFPPNCVPLYK